MCIYLCVHISVYVCRGQMSCTVTPCLISRKGLLLNLTLDCGLQSAVILCLCPFIMLGYSHAYDHVNQTFCISSGIQTQILNFTQQTHAFFLTENLWHFALYFLKDLWEVFYIPHLYTPQEPPSSPVMGA